MATRHIQLSFFALFVAGCLALGLGPIGCFSPQPESGRLTCSLEGACPRGYYCAWDNGCWRDSDSPPPRDGGARDGAARDAASDASDGSAADSAISDLARRD